MADEREQDGLGRDAAHGDDRPATTGGSYGRNTGHSSDDLLEIGDQGDGTERQRDAGSRREGLEGKGFDAGTGYGGGGNASAYGGESSYGGQAGGRDSSMRGAYAGDDYGRQGDEEVSAPRGTDEQGGGEGGAQGNARGGDDATELDLRPDAGRRDPTR